MEWINLKTNPPDKNGEYLFCGVEAITNTKYLCRVNYWDNGEIRPTFAPSVCWNYWMPLPKPPKKEGAET